MLNRSASLAMSTSVLKALPGKLDIKRHSPSILYLQGHYNDKIIAHKLNFKPTNIARPEGLHFNHFVNLSYQVVTNQ